jgi:signal transduction histidine kinase
VIVGGWLVFVKRKRLEESLQTAEQEAERANNAKSRFLETTSNDMRQKLQTLNLLSAVLRKTTVDPKIQALCVKQSDAVIQLGNLLNDILEFSELESGEVELKMADVPIQEVFQQLQGEFEGQAQAKDLQFHFTSRHAVAYSDRVILTRIMRSLISNAIRYTNHGSVKVSCLAEPDGLKITVQDSGIGISPDNLARIFDEFYRIDHDPVGRNGGRGLGLAIVNSSVKLLGTKAEVVSEPGKGSSFSFIVLAAGQDFIPRV